LGDQDSGGRNTFWGDALCLFSAIMYGVYTTAMKLMAPEDAKISFQLMFGYLGLFNALMLLPVLLILLFSAPAVSRTMLRGVMGWGGRR
jgi:solute carrier family 35, member F5